MGYLSEGPRNKDFRVSGRILGPLFMEITIRVFHRDIVRAVGFPEFRGPLLEQC